MFDLLDLLGVFGELFVVILICLGVGFGVWLFDESFCFLILVLGLDLFGMLVGIFVGVFVDIIIIKFI